MMYCLVLVLLLPLVSAQVIPSVFTFPNGNRERTVNGSSVVGNCVTSVTTNCPEPTSSVLFDGNFSTPTELNGSMWASQLLTIRSGFDLEFSFAGTPGFTGVRRVEIVLFNCPEWGISVESIALRTSAGPAGSINPRVSSCDSPVRVCIGDLNTNSAQTNLTLSFTPINTNDWVHIAEVTFYGAGPDCQNETVLTTPTMPTTTDETTFDSTGTITTGPASTMETTTSPATVATTAPTDTGSSDAGGAIAGGVVVAILAIIAVAIAVIGILYLRHKKYKEESYSPVENQGAEKVEMDEKIGDLSPSEVNMDVSNTLSPTSVNVDEQSNDLLPNVDERSNDQSQNIDNQSNNQSPNVNEKGSGQSPIVDEKGGDQSPNVDKQSNDPLSNGDEKGNDPPPMEGNVNEQIPPKKPARLRGSSVASKNVKPAEEKPAGEPVPNSNDSVESGTKEKSLVSEKPAGEPGPDSANSGTNEKPPVSSAGTDNQGYEVIDTFEGKLVPKEKSPVSEKPAAEPVLDSADPMESGTKDKSSVDGAGTDNQGYELMDHFKPPASYTDKPPQVAERKPPPLPLPNQIKREEVVYAEPGPPPIPLRNESGDINDQVYKIENLAPETFLKDPRPDDESSKEELYSCSSIYTVPEVVTEVKPLQVTIKNFKEIRSLGSGHFGEVVLAETKGLTNKDLKMSGPPDAEAKVQVAIKMLARASDKEVFEKECKFMSRLNDNNVIRLLGVCMDTKLFIMMEYMENGDLNQYLHLYETVVATDSPDGNSRDLKRITTSTVISMCRQIASGMKYLASKNFVHRDLATRNCLVGSNYLVKIADFGMSRNMYESHYYVVKGRITLPVRWMAAECFYGQFSVKTDVWSFGVTMWEIFELAKHNPYYEMEDRDFIKDAVNKENRAILSRPEACPMKVYQDVMLRCWALEPAERETFEKLHETLSNL